MTVVLLHGLARSRRSLTGLRRHLERAGYATWAKSYPSRRLSVAGAAAAVAEWIRADLAGQELCAVTHSLGGILVRHMPLPWRGVVMLAPPNQGSRAAAAFRRHPLFRWFYGSAGQELAEAAGWPAPPRPFAVIAGTRSRALGNPTSWLAGPRVFARGEPNDGTVAVAETRHEAMASFATVDASHTFIMDHPQARALVVDFLARL